MSVTISTLVNTDTFGDWKDKTNDLIDMAGKTLTIGAGETNSGNVEISGNVTVEQTLFVDTIQPYTVGPDTVTIDSDLEITGELTRDLSLRKLTPAINLYNTGITDSRNQIYHSGIYSKFRSRGGTSAYGGIDFSRWDGTTDDIVLRITPTGRVGIQNTTPSTELDVTGTVTATELDVTGTVTANTFSGSGASLTNLNGSNIASGTISASYLPNAGAAAAGIVTTGTQTFAGTKTFSSTISGSINGNAATATNLSNARTIDVTGVTATGQNFDGSANIDIEVTAVPSSLLTGTIASGRISGSYTGITGTGALNAGSITSGFGNINIGTSTFTGNGSGLTNISDSALSANVVKSVSVVNTTNGETGTFEDVSVSASIASGVLTITLTNNYAVDGG